MKRTHSTGSMAVAALLALLAAPLAFGVGTGGTGLRAAYVHAAIAPVPGVVVNGVNFDPSQAMIRINGQDGRSSGELRPGMVAGIDGFVNPGTQDGIASTIRVRRVALGRVLQVGSGGTGLRVAGILVNPRTDTVIGGCSTLADVGYGTTVDVYGYSDGVSGVADATRIECTGASDVTELHGVASAVTLTTMVVHGVTVDISTAQFVGFTAPTAGDEVSVIGVTIGQEIFATTVTLESEDGDSSNGEEAEVEDAIGAVISPSVFVVDQFEIDATNATFSGGTAANLVVGRVVHVSGIVVNGILVAHSVEFDDGESAGGGGAGSSSGDGSKSGSDGTSGSSGGGSSGDGSSSGSGDGTQTDSVDGKISALASAASFVVDGIAVDASAATFVNGAATDLAIGTFVKVIGARTGKAMKAAKVRIGSGDNGASGGDDEGSSSDASGDDEDHEDSDQGSGGGGGTHTMPPSGTRRTHVGD
jgi:hypothetical protein